MNPIIVQRAPADNQGPDISDPLIVTEQVALANGRSRIDQSCSDRIGHAGTMAIHSFIATGSLADVMDNESGQFRAKVTDFAITIDLGEDSLTAQSSVVLERRK